MLARLGHDALVGGHDEHHQVDARGAGEHVLDEPLMARDINDANTRPIGHVQVGEADVDGQLPGLLLGEPVRVDARQRSHELRLAVVDMTGGADNDAGGLGLLIGHGHVPPAGWG